MSQYALSRFAVQKEERPVAGIALVVEQLEQLAQVAEESLQSYWNSWLEEAIPEQPRLLAVERAEILIKQRMTITQSLPGLDAQLDANAKMMLKGKEAPVRDAESLFMLIAMFEQTLQGVVTGMRAYAKELEERANEALPTKETIDEECAAKKTFLTQQIETAYLPVEEQVWLTAQVDRLIAAFAKPLQDSCEARRNIVNHDVNAADNHANNDPIVFLEDEINPNNSQSNASHADLNPALSSYSDYFDDEVIDNAIEEDEEKSDEDNKVTLANLIAESKAVDARIEKIQQAAAVAFAQYQKQLMEVQLADAQSAEALHRIFEEAQRGYGDYQEQLRGCGAEPYIIDQLLALLKSQWELVEHCYRRQWDQLREDASLVSDEVKNESPPIEITKESLRAEEPYKTMYIKRLIDQLRAKQYAHFAEVGLSFRQGARDYIAMVRQKKCDNRDEWKNAVESDASIVKLKKDLKVAYIKAQLELHSDKQQCYLGSSEEFEVIKDEQVRHEIIGGCLKIVHDAHAFWKQMLVFWVESKPRGYGEVSVGHAAFYEKPLSARLTVYALWEEHSRLNGEIGRGKRLLEQHEEEIIDSSQSLDKFNNEYLERIKQHRQGKQAALEQSKKDRQEKEAALKRAEESRIRKEAVLKRAEEEHQKKEEYKAKYELMKAMLDQQQASQPDSGNASSLEGKMELNADEDKSKELQEKGNFELPPDPAYSDFFVSSKGSFAQENQGKKKERAKTLPVTTANLSAQERKEKPEPIFRLGHRRSISSSK